MKTRAAKKSNIFVVVDCKKRRPVLATNSARKAMEKMSLGMRIEVWNSSRCVDIVYCKNSYQMDSYVQREKEYIEMKQKQAEERNRKRHESVRQ